MNKSTENTAQSGVETEYCVAIPYQSGSDAKNDWHKHCQDSGIPCITVTRTGRAKHAHVTCDCSTLPTAMQDIMEGKRKELEAEYKSLFQDYRGSDSCLIPSLKRPCFSDIHMDVAEDLAFELLMLLQRRLKS